MPLEVSEEQEINDIIIALTRLRLCRERFNSEIELRVEEKYVQSETMSTREMWR